MKLRDITQRLLLVVSAAMLGSGALAAEEPKALRVAITPVVLEENLDLNRHLVAYIGEKLGVPTSLVQRRSYKEVSDLLEHAQVDVAFTCGLPYVIDHDRFGLELLAAPVVDDAPVYFAYVIVPQSSPDHELEHLRGKRFAFSDPLSNSGWLVPVHALVQMKSTPEAFFKRTIFTYSHTESVEAVAVKLVDGASVDSYVYDHLAKSRPELVARTRIIHRSSEYPAPPVVVRPGLPDEDKRRLRTLLLEMEHDPRGIALLAAMRIRRFVAVDDASFDGIREMRRIVSERYGAGQSRRGTPSP
jgi:phosphonate transport system substrate-binding protein